MDTPNAILIILFISLLIVPVIIAHCLYSDQNKCNTYINFTQNQIQVNETVAWIHAPQECGGYEQFNTQWFTQLKTNEVNQNGNI